MANERPAILDDKEALSEMYQEMTSKQIAAKLGCAQSTVGRALVRLGIPRRKPHRISAPALNNPAKLAELVEIYSQQEIAEMLGCSKSTVNKRLRRFGISVRPQSLHLDRGNGRINPRRVAADEWGLTWAPRDAKELIDNCWWRLHVLAGICPLNCPDAGTCNGDPTIPEDDGRKGCPMYNRLRNRGEFNPRPWEPDNPFPHWQEKLADVPNRHVDDGLGIPYY